MAVELMNAPLPDTERPTLREDPVPAWTGSQRGRPKLTPAQVREIRRSKERGSVFAARFGVSDDIVSRVRRNISYVDPDYEPPRRSSPQWKRRTREFRGPGYAEAYRRAEDLLPATLCPMEAGIVGRLVDGECEHGRLPGDRTEACGCWGGM